MLVEKDLLPVETVLLHGCLCTVLEASLSRALWLLDMKKNHVLQRGARGEKHPSDFRFLIPDVEAIRFPISQC